MKNIILILLLLGFNATNAQKLLTNEVPKAVNAAFKKSHPTASQAEWIKNKTQYQVKYIAEKKQRVLTYTNSGTLVVHDGKVAISTLPPGVKIYLDKNFPGGAVDKVLKITKIDGEVIYNVEVSATDLFFDAKGKHLRSVKI